jgi:hypothetical protein
MQRLFLWQTTTYVSKGGQLSYTILTLVHFDVCKPMQTYSHGGVQYFLTFIDDYNHYLVVVLLKSKIEVFQHFKNYKVMLKNKPINL